METSKVMRRIMTLLVLFCKVCETVWVLGLCERIGIEVMKSLGNVMRLLYLCIVIRGESKISTNVF